MPCVAQETENSIGFPVSSRLLRLLITAGQRDPICPAPLTLSLAEYLNLQGADVGVEWHAGGHDIRSNEIEAVQAFLK